MNTRRFSVTLMVVVGILSSQGTFAQTSEFTYQGRLLNGGNSAIGDHDFEFGLFDAVVGGNQLGSTIPVNNVALTDGYFSVILDFGSHFPGANRFLEIKVRPSGAGAFTTLIPRQQVTSAPYSIRSLNAENAATATNAAQLGGVAANQYVLTGDSRLSDARNPLPNSASYIQNTSLQQAGSNFNISGNGTVGGNLSANTLNGNGSAITNLNAANIAIGTLSVARGGTGLAVSGTAGNYLRSNGASWISSAIQGSDLPNGSTFYVQNRATQQASTNFNISGTGTANVFNATTQFNIGGSRVFSVGGNANTFAGVDAGASNSTGSLNTFLGNSAGHLNTSGEQNTYVGYNAGRNFSSGLGNTFIGVSAGSNIANGSGNVFVGQNAGNGASSGSNNVFVGRQAGLSSSASGNTFVGSEAALVNESGSNNSSLGFRTSFGSPTLTNATAIGYLARADCSSCLVLGSVNGVNGATSSTNVGIGTTSPAARLHVVGDGRFGRMGIGLDPPSPTSGLLLHVDGDGQFDGDLRAGKMLALSGGSAAEPNMSFVNDLNTGIFQNGADTLNFSTNGASRVQIGSTGNVGIATTAPSERLHVVGNGLFTGNVGIGTTAPSGKLHVVGTGLFTGNVGIGTTTPTGKLHVIGDIRVTLPGSGGATPLCWNSSTQISFCSSSVRYKTNIAVLKSGLNLINRLRPVTFNWKERGRADLGLVAEEVAGVDPLLVTYNNKGEIEGVKYDRVGVVLVNAVKELKAENDSLKARVADQQKQIDDLRKLVSEINLRSNRKK